MRILTITNLYPNPLQPQRGVFNYQQVKALAAQHDVAVIAPIAWTDQWRAPRRAAQFSNHHADLSGVQTEHPLFVFVPRMLRGWQGRFMRWSIRRAFDRVVQSFRPDVVFATWAYPDGWAAVDLAHRCGLPVVLKVHGSDIRLLLDRYPARRPGTIEALQRANQVIAVSRDLAERVVALGAARDRVHVVYNGVDTHTFTPGSMTEARTTLGLDPERPIVLFVGNLVPVKGVDVLLNACTRLRAQGVAFSLHIVGDGALRRNLVELANAQGLAEHVTFHGEVPHQQLPNWYRAASVLVLPSRSEGVPNVLREAAACGTPFVASDVGGVREFACDGIGRLIRPDDANELGEALTQVLSDSSRGMSHQVVRVHADAARELTTIFERAIADAKGPANPAKRETLPSTWPQVGKRFLARWLRRPTPV